MRRTCAGRGRLRFESRRQIRHAVITGPAGPAVWFMSSSCSAGRTCLKRVHSLQSSPTHIGRRSLLLNSYGYHQIVLSHERHCAIAQPSKDPPALSAQRSLKFISPVPGHIRPTKFDRPRVFLSTLLPSPTNRTVASTMSSPTAIQTPSTPPSDLNSVLDAALSEYKKTTGGGLLEHPLAKEVKECDTIGAISAILQGQAREFRQFKDGDQRLMKWIDPMVETLSSFSETFGGVASVVRPGNPVRSHLKYNLM